MRVTYLENIKNILDEGKTITPDGHVLYCWQSPTFWLDVAFVVEPTRKLDTLQRSAREDKTTPTFEKSHNNSFLCYLFRHFQSGRDKPQIGLDFLRNCIHVTDTLTPRWSNFFIYCNLSKISHKFHVCHCLLFLINYPNYWDFLNGTSSEARACKYKSINKKKKIFILKKNHR